MEPAASELWKDLLLLFLYVAGAWAAMYLIVGPPLERLLQKIRPGSGRHELYRWQDWLVLSWGIVNLIIMSYWLMKYRHLGLV